MIVKRSLYLVYGFSFNIDWPKKVQELLGRLTKPLRIFDDEYVPYKRFFGLQKSKFDFAY